MGACGSSLTAEEKAAIKKNKELNKQQNEAENQDSALVKLLLLGAGESGKSTIFKQMRILYGNGFDDASRKALAPIICSNLVGGTRTVLSNCEPLKVPLQDPEAVKAAELVNTCEASEYLTEELAKAIALLWKDADFQKTYDLRAEYQLFDCYADFAKKAKDYPDWGGENWTPSVGDTLKARVRTSGIVEEHYNIDGVDFRMYDVGGQRNERKKWIHCFDGVTAIIFVGAISEYDQVLYEDKNQNRLIEAVELFNEICNSKWFIQTAMILFLNKRDLFEMKYLDKHVPLQKTGLPFFESAPRDAPSVDRQVRYENATNWMLEQFLTKNQNPEKEIYHHITCATDSNNVATVFNACKDVILKGNLKGSGFLE